MNKNQRAIPFIIPFIISIIIIDFFYIINFFYIIAFLPIIMVRSAKQKLFEEQKAKIEEEVERNLQRDLSIGGMSRVVEKRKKEIIDITRILNKILQHEKDEERELNKTDMIRIFKFTIDDAAKYINILNNPVKYLNEEIPNLKIKAGQILQEFEAPTLYNIINELGYDYITAKKISQLIVNEGLIGKIPRTSNQKMKSTHQKDQSSNITRGSKVFLSYSTLDTNHFRIKESSKALDSYPDIEEILYWEANSGENIVEYMERTLKDCNVFVLFCSENALNSKAVTDEWQAAFQLRKQGKLKIVPIFEDEKHIPALLTPLLNVKFIKENFIDFIIQLYKEILRE